MAQFEKIGVVGAGMMGSEIALVCALSGRPTLLGDQTRDVGERAIERVHETLDRGVPRGFWSAEAAEVAKRQLVVADSLDAYADRDFVIEAVFENEALKRDVFARLDAILPPAAGLASNTSSISVTTLSAAVAPSRRARRGHGGHEVDRQDADKS
jgi:3-hydroxybutyryl-CoA dehydrogenase